jgi:hypothetical protein
MGPLIVCIWQICLLQKGPQDLPYSPSLFLTAFLANALLGWYQFTHRLGLLEALFNVIVFVLILLAFTYLVLFLKNKVTRFMQTLTALMTTSVVINLIILPFLLLAPALLGTEPGAAQISIVWFYTLLIITMNIWSLLITAHIYRHALDVNMAVGILVTLGLFACNLLAFSALGGNP